MMYRRYTLIAVLAGLVAGCGLSDSGSADRSTALDAGTVPDSEVSGARVYLYDGGRVTTEIVAERIVQFESQDSTMAYQLDIDSFDSLGQLSSEVIGDSAVIREEMGQFVLFGNVVVITPDNVRLETDLLHWNTKTDRIHTDAFVRITRDGDVITGWGLEADQRVRTYKVLHQVSGEMSDPERLTEP